jgi:WD40 repeat protein
MCWHVCYIFSFVSAPGYQRDYQSKAAINTVALHPNQGEIIAGDEDGNIRVWDLTANTCSYELVNYTKYSYQHMLIRHYYAHIFFVCNA